MKNYIKTYKQFESKLFVPRNLDSRYDDIKRPYVEKGYKSEEIYIGDINIESKEELLNNKYKVVIGDFSCSYNKLESLKGCPELVIGFFDCAYCSLTTLKYGPNIVKNGFYCFNNKLTSLEYCPKEVGGIFNCIFNDKKFTIEEVRKACNVKGKILV